MDELLEAAGHVIGARGYEAATMTEIAERAGASIGAVYQYFPDKASLAGALRVRLGEELATRWATLEPDFAALPPDQLAARIVDLMARFMEERPAYLPLLNALPGYRKDPEARLRFRERFGELLRARGPELGREEALRVAKVVLQLVKGLNQLYLEAGPAERKRFKADFTEIVARYLESKLG